MARQTHEELQKRLGEASSLVRVGASYAHYKDPEKTYRVDGFVIIESTNQVGVVYSAEYGKKIAFVRPLANWLDKISWRGKYVPRFTRVVK